jgi:putative hydrolase of the HAD superfamily
LCDLTLPETGVVVFDLDDTLYPERDFVLSGFRAVAALITDQADVFDRLVELFNAGEGDSFGRVLAENGLPAEMKRQLVQTYRDHMPTLTLAAGVVEMLNRLRASGRSLGIITDGRSVTQRNKIRALGLDAWFDTIVISDEFGSAKPDERNYLHFEERFPGQLFVYVGNDVVKDFIAPNRLGWQTVGLRHDARHIHSPPQAGVHVFALPQFWIERLA